MAMSDAQTCPAGGYRAAGVPVNVPFSISIDISTWRGTPVDNVKLYQCTYLRQINMQPAFTCTPKLIVHWCKANWNGLILSEYLPANEGANPICYRNFYTENLQEYNNGEPEALQFLLQNTVSYSQCGNCQNIS